VRCCITLLVWCEVDEEEAIFEDEGPVVDEVRLEVKV